MLNMKMRRFLVSLMAVIMLSGTLFAVNEAQAGSKGGDHSSISTIIDRNKNEADRKDKLTYEIWEEIQELDYVEQSKLYSNLKEKRRPTDKERALRDELRISIMGYRIILLGVIVLVIVVMGILSRHELILIATISASIFIFILGSIAIHVIT